MDSVILATGVTALLANVGLGGAVFEYSIVDRAWPKKPEIIQPRKGGISRGLFWIPAHTVFELALLVTLFLAWNQASARNALLVCLAAHVAMRIWSAFDMIPKALAFEKAETVDESAAQEWTRRSLMRFPLALLTSISALTAFGSACGL